MKPEALGCAQTASMESLFAPPGAAGMLLGPFAGSIDGFTVLSNRTPVPSGTQNLNRKVLSSAISLLDANSNLDAMTTLEVG